MDFDLVKKCSEYGFFQSFIDIQNGNDPTLVTDIENSIVSDPNFRLHISSKYVDSDLVKELAPYVSKAIMKPQRPIILEDDMYTALDISTNTYYMCSKNLLMIDIDNYKGATNIRELPHCLCQIYSVRENKEQNTNERQTIWNKYPCNCNKKANRLRYRVYKSRNGFHCFVISHLLDHRDEIATQLSIEAGSDYYYVIFSYIRGCSVRLNRKPDEKTDTTIYKYLTDIVCGNKVRKHEDHHLTLISKRAIELVDKHMELTELFSQTSTCETFNVQ